MSARTTALVLAAALVALPARALAHSGGTDANGCHTNRSTGDYEPGLVAVPLSGGLTTLGLFLFLTGWSDMETEREIRGERKRSAFEE